ncbi:Neurofibromin 1, variant 2 [Balamuthia mandrillaris]
MQTYLLHLEGIVPPHTLTLGSLSSFFLVCFLYVLCCSSGSNNTTTNRQVNTAEREQRPKSPKRILPKALSLRGTSTVQLEQLSKMKRVKGTQIGVNDFSTYLEGIATMPPQEMKKEGMDIVYLSHIKPLFNKPALRRQLITELLLEPSLRTVRAVCDSVDVNSQKDLTKALINLFSHNGTVLTLLKGIMYEEIQNTLDLSTLFRANSIAAKMLGHYIRMVGVPYITKMLSPLLEEIYNEDKSLEIDSFRNEQLTETEVRENTEELGKICTKFLDRVDSVLEECPYQFRVICNFLHEEVKKKFPDIAWPVAVGNFFYLRFICPAIVAPETMSPELVQYTTKKNTKRTLVLVSKTLQNVANGTKFFKEPFMMGMGPWIRDNLPRCEKVFEHLAVIPENKEPAKEATTQEPVECMFIIQTYLDKYRPAFIGTLEKYTETSTMDVSLTFYDRLMGILPEHPVSEKTALSAATLERLPVLTNMILEESWCVTSAILDVATKPPEAEGPKEDWSDRVAEAIVVLYELYNRTPDLLLFQFSHDTVIHKPSTQETMALKLFRCYCRLLCDDMLKDVLQTHLTKICSNDLCLVIDDSRNGESHQQQLAQLLKEMTTDVLKGLSLAPPPLWIIVQGLEKRMKEDRAQRKVKPLFSPIQFLFNALYIPALLDPVSYGLLNSAPSERSASTIALIAKAWNFATSPDQPQTFTSSSSVSLSTINQSVAFLFQTISSFFAKWLEGQPTDTAYQSRCDLRWWDQQSSPTSLSSPRALSPLSSPHSPSSPSSLATNIKQRVVFHLFSFLQENVSLFQYSLTKETTVKLEYKLPELFSSLVKHVVRRETTGKPLAIDMTGKVVASPVTCSAASSPASSGTLMAVTPEEESDERARKKKLKGEKKKLKKEKKEEKKRKGSKRG